MRLSEHTRGRIDRAIASSKFWLLTSSFATRVGDGQTGSNSTCLVSRVSETCRLAPKLAKNAVSDTAARDPQEEAMAAPHTAPEVHRELLQFGVFGLRFLQDGDVGVRDAANRGHKSLANPRHAKIRGESSAQCAAGTR